jgi:hypothetical protein
MDKKSKYSSLTEWKNAEPNAYNAAKRKGLIEEIRLICGWKKNGYWTKDSCIEEAKKYNSIEEWEKNSIGSFVFAKKRKYIAEIRLMFGWRKIKPSGYWTKENCMAEAKKYNTIGEWRKNSDSSYTKAISNKWLDECSGHLIRLQNQRPSKTWDKNTCFETAKLFKRPSDWAKNYSGAVASAKKNGWLDEMTAHMTKRKTLPNRYWKNKENILAEAKKYNTIGEWRKNSASSYNSAKIYGWFDEASIHMVSEIVREKFLNKKNDIRCFNAFIQSKEFLELFDKFKETFVDLPHIKSYRY